MTGSDPQMKQIFTDVFMTFNYMQSAGFYVF